MNYDKWYKKNYGWLATWLNNTESYDDYIGMQIFKVKSVVDKIKFETLSPEFVDRFHNSSLELLKYDILKSCVLGVSNNINICTPERYGQSPRAMSGFMEQVGRLPTKYDKVKIIYLAGNGITRWMERHELLREQREDDVVEYLPGQAYIYLSECKLEVL